MANEIEILHGYSSNLPAICLQKIRTISVQHLFPFKSAHLLLQLRNFSILCFVISLEQSLMPSKCMKHEVVLILEGLFEDSPWSSSAIFVTTNALLWDLVVARPLRYLSDHRLEAKILVVRWSVELKQARKLSQNGAFCLSYRGRLRNFSCRFLAVDQVFSLGPPIVRSLGLCKPAKFVGNVMFA